MLGRPPAALSSFPVVNLMEPLNWLLKLSEVSYATCLSSALSKLIVLNGRQSIQAWPDRNNY